MVCRLFPIIGSTQENPSLSRNCYLKFRPKKSQRILLGSHYKTLTLTNGLKDHDDSEEDEEHETYRFKSEVVTARPWYRNLVHIYLQSEHYHHENTVYQVIAERHLRITQIKQKVTNNTDYSKYKQPSMFCSV